MSFKYLGAYCLELYNYQKREENQSALNTY